MSSICDRVTAEEAAGLGRKAVLSLRLQEAQRNLAAVRHDRASYDSMSVECRALADEYQANAKHVQAGAMMAASVRYRCRVIALDVEAMKLQEEIAGIERRMAVQAPVVLSAAQVSAMDETAGLCGVAA